MISIAGHCKNPRRNLLKKARVPIFLKTKIFFLRFSLSSTRKRRFRASKNVGFRKRSSESRLHRKACNRISIVFAFMCGRAQTIRISYVWMRLKGIVQMTFWWPKMPADKRNIFSNKTTRHFWVLKTCYYSEEGQKTDGNFNSILNQFFNDKWTG